MAKLELIPKNYQDSFFFSFLVKENNKVELHHNWTPNYETTQDEGYVEDHTHYFPWFYESKWYFNHIHIYIYIWKIDHFIVRR